MITYTGHQQLHLHTFSHFQSLRCKRKRQRLQLWYQAGKNPPMSLVFLGTIRRSSCTILMASRRISKILLMSASRGARGNAATNMVVKLNCMTGNVREWHAYWVIHIFKCLHLTEDTFCYFIWTRLLIQNKKSSILKQFFLLWSDRRGIFLLCKRQKRE